MTVILMQFQKFLVVRGLQRYGTLPFAGLACAGFVAVQMLTSLVKNISPEDYESFMASQKTVSSVMGNDFHKLSKADFLSTYGHLRPGTYDILSPRDMMKHPIFIFLGIKRKQR